VKNPILIDTAYILALSNRRDQYHEQASKLVSKYKNYRMVVTDAVLLEVGNTLARGHRQAAAAAIEQLISSDDVEVVHLTPDLFQRAFAMYKAFQDKTWSLVDCISFVVMRDAGIKDALTSDRHFEQAGFQVLMREDAGT
jgi:predicted nucleic acid-binding protein